MQIFDDEDMKYMCNERANQLRVYHYGPLEIATTFHRVVGARENDVLLLLVKAICGRQASHSPTLSLRNSE